MFQPGIALFDLCQRLARDVAHLVRETAHRGGNRCRAVCFLAHALQDGTSHWVHDGSAEQIDRSQLLDLSGNQLLNRAIAQADFPCHGLVQWCVHWFLHQAQYILHSFGRNHLKESGIAQFTLHRVFQRAVKGRLTSAVFEMRDQNRSGT